MRPVVLKFSIYLLNVVFLAALCGSVYLVFFTKKAEIDPPSLRIGTNFVSSQNFPSLVGYSQADLNSLVKVFATPVVAAATESEEANEKTEDENGDVTELDKLVVIGVIFDSTVPEDSCAVLFDMQTGEQINVFTGDVYKGWTLDKVLDRITIMLVKGDVSQKVVKTRVSPTKDQPKVAVNSGSNTPASRGINRGTSSLPSSNNRSKTTRQPTRPKRNYNNQAVNGRIKKSISKRALKDLIKQKNKLMGEVYAKPFLDKGKPIGMQVTTIAENSQLNQFGLQPGDIVTSWNGQPIVSEADCYRIMREYENNVDSLPAKNEIIVIRNGQRVVLDVDLK